jgi:hypothetical protein
LTQYSPAAPNWGRSVPANGIAVQDSIWRSGL